MLIGHVSDELYSALADGALEFVNDRGESWEARSRASGSVPGRWIAAKTPRPASLKPNGANLGN